MTGVVAARTPALRSLPQGRSRRSKTPERLNIYIETYGCQMNEYDSELVRSISSMPGTRLPQIERDAHVVLLNTCAVRENAHSRVYGRLQELKGEKTLKGKARPRDHRGTRVHGAESEG